MGVVYGHLGKYDEALQQHEKALIIEVSALGEDHQNTQMTKRDIQMCNSRLAKK